MKRILFLMLFIGINWIVVFGTNPRIPKGRYAIKLEYEYLGIFYCDGATIPSDNTPYILINLNSSDDNGVSFNNASCVDAEMSCDGILTSIGLEGYWLDLDSDESTTWLTASDVKTISPYSTAFHTGTFWFSLPEYHAQGISRDISFAIYPKDIQIYNEQGYNFGNKVVLTDQDMLKMYATRGFFPDAYHWQYSFDGLSWTSFPEGMNWTDSLCLIGSNFLQGVSFLDLLQRNTTVQVRIKYGDDQYSNQVIADIKLSAPKFTISSEQPTCFKEDGKIKIHLDRPLETKEKLAIVVSDTNGIGTGGFNDTILQNIQDYQRNIGAGTYSVSLIGRYTTNAGGDVYTFVKGSEADSIYSYRFTIRDTTPYQFEVGTVKDVSCNGGIDGAIAISVPITNWNRAPYTIFNNDTALTNPSALVAGSYKISVRDANGCFAKNSEGNILVKMDTIREPEILRISSFDIDSVTTLATPNGKITVHAVGGTRNYFFAWNDIVGQSRDSVRDLLSADTYTVIVTDSKGCAVTGSCTVSAIAAPTIAVTIVDSVFCKGASNGKVAITASGGGGQYVYFYKQSGSANYSDTISSSTINNLSAGTYLFKVADRYGNEAISDVITISEPAQALKVEIDVRDSIRCYGEGNGSLRVTTGGDYSIANIKWMNNNMDSIGSDSVLNGLSSGTYSITVTDAKYCKSSDTIILGQPDVLSMDSIRVKIPTTYDGNDGAIHIYPSGGNGGYSYAWSNEGSLQNLLNIPTQFGAYYRVTVTDRKGCTRRDSVRVVYPLTITIEETHPVSCHGDIDGQLKAVARGGIGTEYMYIWDLGLGLSDTSEFLNNRAAGTFYVKGWAIADNTQRVSDTFILRQPERLAVRDSVVIPSEYNTSDGQIHLTVMGGTSPYAYQWTTPQPIATTSNYATGLPTDTAYKVVVRDAHGCKDSVSPHIIYPLSAAITIDSIRCPNGKGGIKAFAYGGVGHNYKYRWSKVDDTYPLFDEDTVTKVEVEAGTYRLQIIDERKDTLVRTIIVTQPEAISTVVEVIAPLCYGDSNGMVILKETTGGKSPYSYDFKQGGASVIGERTLYIRDTIRHLANGVYELITTDSNECETEEPIAVQQPKAIAYDSVVQLPSTYDATDGSIELIIVQDTLYPHSYTYLWDDGITNTPFIANLPARDTAYTLTITNELGCKTLFSQRLIYPLSVHITLIDSVTCYENADGALSAFAYGGVGKNYRYQWTQVDSTRSLSTDSVVRNLYQGLYRIQILDHENNAIYDTFNLTAPAALALELSDNKAPACYGFNDGYIVAQVQGGTQPYQYTWKDQPAYDTSKRSDLPAGKYSVEIQDAKQCITSDSLELKEPDSLVLQAVLTLPSKYDTNDGYIAVQPTGGTEPYRYLWTHNLDTTRDLSAVAARDTAYTLQLIDYQNCEADISVRVIYPLYVEVAEIERILCAGDRTSKLVATAYGGVGRNYTYAWVSQSDTVNVLSYDAVLSNIGAGIYRVQVTDRENNTAYSSWVEVAEPPVLTVDSVSVVLPSDYGLADGRIYVSVSGGVLPYHYAWSDSFPNTNTLTGLTDRDSAYRVTISDAHACTATTQGRLIMPIKPIISVVDSISCANDVNGKLQASALGGVGKTYRYQWYKRMITDTLVLMGEDSVLTNVDAGLYYLKVTDVENNDTLSAMFPFFDPSSLEIKLEVKDLLCKNDSDGEVIAFASGGMPPYRYSWHSSVTDQMLVKDSERAVGFVNLQEGSYTVQISDRRECPSIAIATVHAPAQVVSLLHSTPPRAYGYSDASIWVTTTGGKMPYTYQWNDHYGSYDTLFDIPKGRYTVTTRDANGCQNTVSDSIQDPPLLEIAVALTKGVSCFGYDDAILSITSQGGVGQRHHKLHKLTNATFVNIAETDSTYFANLGIGIYQIAVQDANGIIAYSDSIEITQPDTLRAQIIVTDVTCYGYNDGALSVHTEGGTAPYTYQWSDARMSATHYLDSLPVGMYEVKVTDNQSCDYVAQATIISPTLLKIEDVRISAPVCNGYSDGYIQISPTGGVAPYRYMWNDSSTQRQISNISAGQYQVTVMDAHQCYTDSVFQVIDPVLFQIAVGDNRVLCKDQVATYSACITDDKAMYQWNKDGSSFSYNCTVALAEAGLYSVKVIDGNGCIAEDTVKIEQVTEVIHNTLAAPSVVARDTMVVLVNEDFGLPETIEWLIPDDPNIYIYDRTQEKAVLLFLQNGDYQVGMRSTLNQCYAISEKTVTVIDKKDIAPYEASNEPFLKLFIVHPNPTAGPFSVKIELREVADVKLTLVNTNGNVIDTRILTTKQTYETTYNVSSATEGVYVLILQTNNIVANIKIVRF